MNGRTRLVVIVALTFIALVAIVCGAVLAEQKINAGAAFAIATACVGALGTLAVRDSK